MKTDLNWEKGIKGKGGGEEKQGDNHEEKKRDLMIK